MASASINPASTPRSPGAPLDLAKALDTSRLKCQNAIVTGGATGIGEGFVRALVGAGAYVTIADIDVANGERVAKDLAGQDSLYVARLFRRILQFLNLPLWQ